MSQKTLGIILAAGKSSRLFPATLATTKQLLPIYDKPLIYYPLTTLMLAGIEDYVIINTPKESRIFQELFHNCNNDLGINIVYGIQNKPLGIADAFNVVLDCMQSAGKNIDEYDNFALILGDNIFYGATMSGILKEAIENIEYASIFSTTVTDPQRFGVVELNSTGEILSLEEKPKNPKSNLAVTGLYVYPTDVFSRVRAQKYSDRGELEITDLNISYFQDGYLNCQRLPRGLIWFDTGTPDAMLEASNVVQALQNYQNIMIGSPHEVAYNNNWISKENLYHVIDLCGKSAYGKYLYDTTQHNK